MADTSSISVTGIQHPTVNAQWIHGLGGPGRVTIESQAQSFAPPLISDITWRQNSTSITLKQCHLVDPEIYSPPTDATTVQLTYLDRRWRWLMGGGVVNGTFNERDAKGKVRKKYEKSPLDLFKLIFGQLNESGVSYPGVDNTLRPTLVWRNTPTYQALTQLLAQLGCRDALTYDNRIKIVRLGVGANLPTTNVMGAGVSVADLICPEFIEIIGAPVQLECDLKLSPVGVELGEGQLTDRYVHPDKLSYAPTRTEGPNAGKKGWWSPEQPSACLPRKLPQIEGLMASLRPTKLDEWTLADRHIFRSFKIVAFGDGTLKVPGNKDGRSVSSMEYVKPLGVLNERLTDDIGQFAEGYIYGEHFKRGQLGDFVWPLYVRADVGFTIDAENMIVHLSEPLWMYDKGGDEITWPNLYLRTCVALLDKNHAEECYRYKKSTGSNNKSGSRPIERPEIVRRVTCKTLPAGEKVNRNTKPPAQEPSYVRSVGSKFVVDSVVDNKADVDKQAKFYWDIEREKARPDAAAVNSYNCLQKIETDGRIQQVVYTMRNGEVTTQASANSEFHPTYPRYEDRLEIDRANLNKGKVPDKLLQKTPIIVVAVV